eukprot:SAG22_NODE_6762_length_809_cov_1.219580_1_plen_57_part_01
MILHARGPADGMRMPRRPPAARRRPGLGKRVRKPGWNPQPEPDHRPHPALRADLVDF